MNISPITLYCLNNFSKPVLNPSFKGNDKPPRDTFVKSSDYNGNFNAKFSGDTVAISTKITENDYPVFEEVGLTDFIDIKAIDKKFEVGLITLATQDDHIYVIKLESPKRKYYKGIGTGLLRQAVLESIKRGFEGRLELSAFDEVNPSIFYYKNNLKIKGANDDYNAVLDFCTRNNIDYSSFAESGPNFFHMYLDNKGANDLLNNIRNFEENFNWTNLLKFNNNFGSKYSVDFAESNFDDGRYIIMTEEKNNSTKLKMLVKITNFGDEFFADSVYDVTDSNLFSIKTDKEHNIFNKGLKKWTEINHINNLNISL